MKIVCVTSCFTGIVNPYLAAEGLQVAGDLLGHTIVVENQGPAGSGPIVESEIDQADGVIFAVDVPVVGRERFVGKPYLEGDLAPAIHSPRELINQLVTQITEGTAQLVSAELTESTKVAELTEAPPSVAPVDSSSERGFFAKLFGRGRQE